MSLRRTRPRLLGATASVLLVTALMAAGPIGAVTAAGPLGLVYRCRSVVTKLGDEITVSFRIRTNRARDDWRVRLFHEGDLVFSRIRTTNADGNLKVVRVVPNLRARDDFVARGRRLETGTICEVESRI